MDVSPEGRFSSQLWPAEGGSGDPGGERALPEGPRAQGRRAHHRRGLQEQRKGLRGLPGDGLQRGAIAERCLRGRGQDEGQVFCPVQWHKRLTVV